jgi:HEAT repeat protein
MEQSLNTLLDGLSDLPLKSAYDQACFLLHCAERGWFSAEQLTRLVNQFKRFDNHLPVHEQVLNCERLVQLTVEKNLSDAENELRAQLIALKRNPTKEFKAMLASLTTDPRRYLTLHYGVLTECVQQRQRQEKTKTSDKDKQQNTNDTHRVEAEVWFDLATPLLLNRLREAKQKNAETVVDVLKRLASLAERLAAEGLYGNARAIYQDILKALAFNVERDSKTCLKQVDESFLVSMLVKISEAERGKQPINRSTTALKPQWPLSITGFQNLREHTTVQLCTPDIQKFVSNLFNTLEQLLGPAPCSYTVVGMGSFARSDMTPYSDLETLVVIKDSAHKSYFKSFYQLLECQIVMLGENFQDRPGFHLDEESNPARDQIEEHIVSPTYYTLEKVITKDQTGELNRFRYTLLTARKLYGDDQLFQSFQASLTDANHAHARSKLAEFGQAWLQSHLDQFARFQEKPLNAQVNLKDDYLKWLTYLLTDLSLCLNLGKSNLFEIINALPLAAYFQSCCVKALEELQAQRFELHKLARQATNTLQSNQRLSLILQGVIEPLYTNAKLLAVPRAQDAPLIDPLLLLTAQLNTQADKARKKSLNICASFLCYYNEPEYYFQIYQFLPVIYRGSFFSLLVEKGAPNSIQRELRYQPNPDGWYPAMDEEKENWLKTFRTLFQTNLTPDLVKAAKQKNAVVIRCSNLRGGQGISEYFLQDAVTTQLFESNGQPKAKPSNQRGRHTVLKVTHLGQIFWFKFTPEQSGTEYAVNRLARHIGDQGTPMTQVIKICHGTQSEGIAVQVAPHIEGLTLEEILQTHPQRVLQLEPRSFTETLLRVLLTNPEDDKGDDYFLIHDGTNQNTNNQETFRLKRIDNERAFYDPTETKGMLKKNEALQVKSMLYCLPQMQMPLSQAALNKFLELDPLLVLQHWLNELQAEHQLYQGLFTDKDVETHFGIKEPGPCLLGIPIAEGLIEELLTRLDSMQQVVRLAKEQGRAVIGMDLLKVVQPTLADFYADAFKAIPDSKPEAALQRFDQVTKNSYKRSKQGIRESRIQSAKAITQSLRLKTKLSNDVVLQMMHGQQNSPTQGLEVLKNLQSKKLEDIKQGLLSENSKETKIAITQFQNLVVRQRLQLFKELVNQYEHQQLSPAKQIILLQAMVGIPFHELSLQTFGQVLTNKLLQPILENAGAHLIKLDLRECVLLTDNTLQLIAESCPNLSYLGLETINKVRLIDGTFSKLNVLDVNNCAELTRIEIDAPQLALLEARGCRELKSIKTNSLLLSEVDLTDCISLEGTGIVELSHFAGHLTKVKLKNSAITHRIFRETYSFLVMLPLHHCSDVCVKRLDEQLQRGIKVRFDDSENDSMLLDTHGANQLYEKLSHRFELAETLLETANNLGIIVNSDNKVIRAKLLGSVALLGYKSEIILKVLVPLLKDSQWEVRDAAVETVGQAGTHVKLSADVLSVLLSLLKDSEWSVRSAAAKAVGQAARHNPSEILLVLLSLLKDSNSDMRLAAAKALVQAAMQVKLSDEVLSALVMLLNDSEERVKSEAIEAVGELAKHHLTEFLVTLLPLLKNSDLGMRYTAAVAIGHAATQIKLPVDVLSALLPMLKDTDKYVRRVAAQAMGQVATQIKIPKEALSALLSLLKYSDWWEIRSAVIDAMGQAAMQIELPADVLLAVVLMLKDYEKYVRRAAAQAIGQAAMQVELPADVISALLPLLKDSEIDVRTAAAKALGKAATHNPAEVLSTLVPLLKDSEIDVRTAAAEAVGQAAMKIKLPADVLAVLVQLLKDSDEEVRCAAVQAIGQAATQVKLAADVLLTLLPLLTDSSLSNKRVRDAVAQTFGQAAAHNPSDVLSALLPLLKESEQIVKEVAAHAFGRAAVQLKSPGEVLTALLSLLKLKDSESYGRADAVFTVGQVATEVKLPTEILSALLPLLKDSESEVRYAAAEAVRQVAKQVKLPTDVLSALLMLLKDSNEEIRRTAVQAVGQAVTHNTSSVVLSVLLPLLKDSKWSVRYFTVKTIGQAATQIQLPADVLLGVLQLLKDSNNSLRNLGQEVLGICISENAFNNDIEFILREATLSKGNNLSLKTNFLQISPNKSNTSSSSLSASAPFWHQEPAASSTSSSSSSSSSSSTSSGLTSNMTVKR